MWVSVVKGEKQWFSGLSMYPACQRLFWRHNVGGAGVAGNKTHRSVPRIYREKASAAAPQPHCPSSAQRLQCCWIATYCSDFRRGRSDFFMHKGIFNHLHVKYTYSTQHSSAVPQSSTLRHCSVVQRCHHSPGLLFGESLSSDCC